MEKSNELLDRFTKMLVATKDFSIFLQDDILKFQNNDFDYVVKKGDRLDDGKLILLFLGFEIVFNNFKKINDRIFLGIGNQYHFAIIIR